ncbi:predicted protein [Lichtheimia corymbifera JMRC:FSU:9682]|uniref:Uncharacterized protein n=1 Tax=Lichtheimia corymbifera JMRC:FSU:9682 TaxID=1263082 RepID=A0A068S8G1_9FUNG|nr:predicted protein [Lichtheimia corymbifera JMRC:FSU:9682]
MLDMDMDMDMAMAMDVTMDMAMDMAMDRAMDRAMDMAMDMDIVLVHGMQGPGYIQCVEKVVLMLDAIILNDFSCVAQRQI